jgi:hypothetical protein
MFTDRAFCMGTDSTPASCAVAVGTNMSRAISDNTTKSRRRFMAFLL